ncbi:hypothetical protein ACFOSC_08735 [Streptantibioticus rubrisoli]|uniref:HTTM-like domain-containing protein n=1 Tax=Streptantibioticus rubrisoli TaxID=1387313 RepID=A0ABT1P5Z5_9ACTN|nr:hypothetical protein [Streptantibioticus rubrisoli]MCQ4040795.1 hypothetical protein [Streptantibioticus rubrisoli]
MLNETVMLHGTITLTETGAARAILAVAGSGLAVSAARDLRQAREFGEGGALAWSVVGAHPHRCPAVVRGLFVWERYRAVLAVQCAAGLAAPVVAALSTGGSAVLACLLLSTLLLGLHRSDFGTDGADQMAALCLLTAAVTLITGGTVGRLCLAFLAGQLVLSYLIAGVAKAVSPMWRDGSCLAQILSTRAYGSPRVAAALRARPHLGFLLAWGVMALEVTFWLTLVLPEAPRWGFLAAGAVMHLGIAVTMGLSTFVFAFTGAYPALLFTAAALTG